jgi:hypothetical protein
MQKSDWELCLESTDLSEEEKKAHRAIIRWFLGYCRKREPTAMPGRDVANQFDRELRRTRNPAQWQLNLLLTRIRVDRV